MLKPYLSSLPDEAARRSFAADCETSLGHLRNSIYSGKPLAPVTCVLIEQRTAGAVMRWHTRPDDWRRIWPELNARDDAPIVCHQTVKDRPPQHDGTADLQAGGAAQTPLPGNQGVRHAA